MLARQPRQVLSPRCKTMTQAEIFITSRAGSMSVHRQRAPAPARCWSCRRNRSGSRAGSRGLHGTWWRKTAVSRPERPGQCRLGRAEDGDRCARPSAEARCIAPLSLLMTNGQPASSAMNSASVVWPGAIVGRPGSCSASWVASAASFGAPRMTRPKPRFRKLLAERDEVRLGASAWPGRTLRQGKAPSRRLMRLRSDRRGSRVDHRPAQLRQRGVERRRRWRSGKVEV